MRPKFFPLPGYEDFSQKLAKGLNSKTGKAEWRHFPDGESLVRVETPCRDEEVAIVAPLHHPDEKTLPIIFLGEALRDLGAKDVGLIAPYLAYMRQDRSFREGEGVSSRYFAKLLSEYFDWMVTVDPHLHRFNSLQEIYSIPTQVVHAAPLVADWIRKNIKKPLLVGPDVESTQWVEEVARLSGASQVILSKVRRGDRKVEVSVPEIERLKDHTPVLFDDIISSGETMRETLGHLKAAGMPPATCIGVHGVFAKGALEGLLKAGAQRVITCNTIPHQTNEIDVSGAVADAILHLKG